MGVTLGIGDTYGDDLREIVVQVMEVDKVADEVTDMEVDKVTKMVAEIPNEDLTGDYWYLWRLC